MHNRRFEYKFKELEEEAEKKRKIEVQAVENRCKQLQEQKSTQDQINAELMKKKEMDHQMAVEELQELYEKKIAIESKKCFNLERELLEMRQHYEDQMKKIQEKNEEGVEKLMSEFRSHLTNVQDEYKKTQKSADDLKTIYEEKLTQQVLFLFLNLIKF